MTHVTHVVLARDLYPEKLVGDEPEELEIEPLLNARDVSKILRCSLPHVYKMADRGQLPCIRWESPGNGERRSRSVVRFKMEDVLQFMENHYEN